MFSETPTLIFVKVKVRKPKCGLHFFFIIGYYQIIIYKSAVSGGPL